MAANKPRLAREATRQKLRDAGLPPEITEKEGLTTEEAQEALRRLREEGTIAGLRDDLALIGHRRASDPSLSLSTTAQLHDEYLGLIYAAKLGPCHQPDRSQVKGSRAIPIVQHPEDTTELVGESHYVSALHSSFRRYRVSDREARTWAWICRDSSNKYDSNAVMVMIEGKTVGYLSRDDAEDVADEPGDWMIANHAFLGVTCSIFSRDGQHFGVWLHAGIDAIANPDSFLLDAHMAGPRAPQREWAEVEDREIGEEDDFSYGEGGTPTERGEPNRPRQVGPLLDQPSGSTKSIWSYSFSTLGGCFFVALISCGLFGLVGALLSDDPPAPSQSSGSQHGSRARATVSMPSPTPTRSPTPAPAQTYGQGTTWISTGPLRVLDQHPGSSGPNLVTHQPAFGLYIAEQFKHEGATWLRLEITPRLGQRIPAYLPLADLSLSRATLLSYTPERAAAIIPR